MVIEGAPVTFINVQLECNTELTPWCLKPEDQVELRRKHGLPMPKFKWNSWTVEIILIEEDEI